MSIQRLRRGRTAYSASTLLTVGNINEKLLLQCELDEGTMYTVQFTVRTDSLENLAITDSELQVLAILEWSVDGNTMRRLISVANGVSITGAGKNVSIKVFDFSILADTNNVFKYLVNVNVAKTVRASGQIQPTLICNSVLSVNGTPQDTFPPFPGSINPGTDFQRQVTSGLGMTVEIPQDAGINCVYPVVANRENNIPLIGNDVTIVGSDVLNQGIIVWDSSTIAKWNPIPPSLKELSLTNNSLDELFCGFIFGVEG